MHKSVLADDVLPDGAALSYVIHGEKKLNGFKKDGAIFCTHCSDLTIKPTVLIGSSGAGRTFTKEVVEAMTSINKIPVILALSNPTSQSECTAEVAYTWSEWISFVAGPTLQQRPRVY